VCGGGGVGVGVGVGGGGGGRGGVAVLHAANLGDSGFWVLRMEGEEGRARISVAHKSRSQSHSFNCPYQVLLYKCMVIYMRVYICMYMWVSRIRSHAPSHTHLIDRTRCCYKFVWIYICVCIYVCTCVFRA